MQRRGLLGAEDLVTQWGQAPGPRLLPGASRTPPIPHLGSPGPWRAGSGTHQPPEVLGGHGDVVVHVAGHLLRVGAQRGCHVVPGGPRQMPPLERAPPSPVPRARAGRGQGQGAGGADGQAVSSAAPTLPHPGHSRVEEARGHAVDQLHHVPVPHGPRRAAHHQLVPAERQCCCGQLGALSPDPPLGRGAGPRPPIRTRCLLSKLCHGA